MSVTGTKSGVIALGFASGDKPTLTLLQTIEHANHTITSTYFENSNHMLFCEQWMNISIYKEYEQTKDFQF